jgi:DNA-binding response OmpR family regulator
MSRRAFAHSFEVGYMPPRHLLPGEDPTTVSAAIAYGWSAIYRQLVLLGQAQERRLNSADAPVSGSAITAGPGIWRRQAQHRARAEFWRTRAWRLKGLGLDDDRRLLSYQGTSVKLSARETQLIRIMLGSPERVFSSRELLELAWKNSHISAEALRNYVPRIRRKLASLQLADICNLAGRGYLLRFRDLVEVERETPNAHPSGPMTKLQTAMTSTETLMPGEELAAPSPTEVALWMALYERLVLLTAAQLNDASAAAATDERSNSRTQSGIAAIRRRLARQEQRLVHWQQQHWELSGLWIDDETRTLSYCGEQRRLTRREHQLLKYLVEVPDQFVSAERLAKVAWPDAFVTPDCLYNYVRRLRLMLAQMAIPCQIQNKPGVGYAVVRNPPPDGADVD